MLSPKIIHLVYSNDHLAHEVRPLIPQEFVLVDCPVPFSGLKLPAPDLFLLCQNGDGKVGHQLLNRIKSDYPDIPVMVVADNPEAQEMKDMLTLGVEDYLMNPVAGTELKKRLTKHLGKDNRWWSWWRNLFLSRNSNRPHPRPTLSAAIKKANFDVHIRLLGSFELCSSEETIPELRSSRNNLLLAYFAYHAEQKIRRDKLMGEFWPEVGQESARNSFNVALCHIRQHFREYLPNKEQIIIHHRGNYQLNPNWLIQTDVHQFKNYFQLGQKMEQNQNTDAAFSVYQKAVQLYRGDFLEGFPFEEWTNDIRDSLQDLHLRILERLGYIHLQRQEFQPAQAIFLKMTALDACRENGHRMLMWCYAWQGQRDLAIRQYQKCKDALAKELQITPSLKTEFLYHSILSGKKIALDDRELW